jgi:hypothetical protein
VSQRPGLYLDGDAPISGGDAPSGTGAIRSALPEWAWSITDAAVVITRVSVVVLIHPVRHDTRKVMGLLKSGQLPDQPRSRLAMGARLARCRRLNSDGPVANSDKSVPLGY